MPRPRSEPVPDEEDADEDGDGEGDESSQGGDGENGADGDRTPEDEERHTDADDRVEPDSVDGRLRASVDSLPDRTPWKTAVSSVSVGDTGSGNHGSLAHGITTHDGKRQDRGRRLLRHHLQEVSCPRLADIRSDDRGYVDDGIRDHQLQEPAKDASDGGCKHDGSRRGDVCVRALFAEMERGVVSAHRPDDSDEAHEDGDACREARSVIYVAPNVTGRIESRVTLLHSVGSCWNHDDDDNEGNDIECRSDGVELRDPLGRHATDTPMTEHDKHRRKEEMPGLWNVGLVVHRRGGQHHGGQRIVD